MGTILPDVSYVYSEFLLQPKLQDKEPSIEGVDLSAPFARFKFDTSKTWREQTLHRLNLAFMSSAMQSVTGHDMATALAKEGALGTVYCSQTVESEAEMIRRVKRFKGGFVVPSVLSPGMTIAGAMEVAKREGHGKYPVTEDGMPNGRLVGLLTEDLYSEKHAPSKVADRMIANDKPGDFDRLSRYIATDDEVGDDIRKANNIMLERARSRVLLIVDKDYRLKCAVFRKDVEEHDRHKDKELVDSQKRYEVAAAINTRDFEQRVPAVIDAGARYLSIDSAQGHTAWQADTLRWIKKKYGDDVKVVAGNFVTPEGFDFAVEHGADAVKVGIGPGSICITRAKFGVGAGQATAVRRIVERRDMYLKETGIYVPIIADGGIVNPSDAIIAYARGADGIMMGRFFAGFHESPTDVENQDIESKDGTKFTALVKPYWGEGSDRAKAWREGRYDQADVEEGVEGYVPYKGRLADTFPIVLREIRTGIHKAGYKGIKDLNDNAQLMRQTGASIREGNPHDVYRSQ